MKHEEIYYTCDRCGEKIDVDMRTLPYIKRFTTKNFATRIETTTFQPISNIDNVIKTANDEAEIVSIQIKTIYLDKHKSFELCGKCRKDFVRFMNNREV